MANCIVGFPNTPPLQGSSKFAKKNFFLKNNSCMTRSQIWLFPLVDDAHVATLKTKLIFNFNF
jgi:hypothetical protein